MHKAIPIIIVALIANLTTVFLYKYMMNHPSSGEGAWVMTFGAFGIWSFAPIIAIILSFIYRKDLFSKTSLGWTLPTLLFCTPVPIWVAYRLTHHTPPFTISSTSYNHRDGKIYKTESLDYTSSLKKYVDKYFVADSIEESHYGDVAFKKDSTWVYLSMAGDTIKVERYKNGKLLTTTSK